MNLNYVKEIAKWMQSDRPVAEVREELLNYHDRDIAFAIESLDGAARKKAFQILDEERLADVFSYFKAPLEYMDEIGMERFAAIVSDMDSDDAVDVLEELDDATRKRLAPLLQADARKAIHLIRSYDEDEIGSQMTTNFVRITHGISVKQATRSLILQADKNDNINTIYVSDGERHYVGAIDLKDLITAREYDDLEDIIVSSYPYVFAEEKIDACVDKIKEYAEDSILVLDEERRIVGVITATDITELVDEEMGEDYAMLAGMTEASDLDETTFQSMKKRLPWLILLLFLGMGVSSVVGLFEQVVAQVALIVCFQSLILDMAGNVGTQSLAVTIRILMDENLSLGEKWKFIGKELRVGTYNGLLLGGMAFLFIGIYVTAAKGKTLAYAFTVSGCVGISLLVAMMISSLVGVLTPMFFHKIKVDPAVASGPLITTINDLIAVVTYYGLSWLLLIRMCGIHG